MVGSRVKSSFPEPFISTAGSSSVSSASCTGTLTTHPAQGFQEAGHGRGRQHGDRVEHCPEAPELRPLFLKNISTQSLCQQAVLVVEWRLCNLTHLILNPTSVPVTLPWVGWGEGWVQNLPNLQFLPPCNESKYLFLALSQGNDVKNVISLGQSPSQRQHWVNAGYCHCSLYLQ